MRIHRLQRKRSRRIVHNGSCSWRSRGGRGLSPTAGGWRSTLVWSMALLALLPIALRLGAASAISNSNAKCFGRFQLSPDRRYASAFPSRESSAPAAPVLRNVLRAPGAGVRVDFSARPRARSRSWLDHLRPSLGGSGAEHRRALRAVLLDAARVDHARDGRWWAACWRSSNSVRSING